MCYSIFDEQLHPYAEGLLAAIPVLGMVQETLAVIPGSVPNLINLPPGCKFAPRCPYAKECASEQVPELVELKPGHRVRCFMREPELPDSGPASRRQRGTSRATRCLAPVVEPGMQWKMANGAMEIERMGDGWGCGRRVQYSHVPILESSFATYNFRG